MHSEISEKLKAYIDKELSFSERRAIGRHLKICADCASKAKAFEITTNAIKNFKEVEAPSGFTQKVMAPPPTPAQPHRQRSWVQRYSQITGRLFLNKKM